MNQQPIPVQNGDVRIRGNDEPRATGSFLRIISALIILVVVVAAVLTVYHGIKFGLDYIDLKINPDKSVQSSVPVMILLGILIIGLVGVLRFLVNKLTDFVRKVFRIGQYDVVTVVTALVINGVLLWINVWFTGEVIKLMKETHISNFFTDGGFFPFAVLFCTIAGGLIWIPRVGVYGENRLGQFDDDRF